jgi:hypothetical protein
MRAIAAAADAIARGVVASVATPSLCRPMSAQLRWSQTQIPTSASVQNATPTALKTVVATITRSL